MGRDGTSLSHRFPSSSLILFFQAYLLGLGGMTPLTGRLSDIVGRKPLLYIAVAIFVAFSAMCGAAKNMTELIAARALQGVGSGMVILLV